jgi:predicted nucleic acid-binding Zn ribbon protein
VTDPAVAATCTEDGLTEGSHCSVCDEVLTAQETVPATGHNYELVVRQAATCTEKGLSEQVCKNCGAIGSAFSTKATGHTVVTDPAVAATCTAAGLTEGSHCSVCGETIVAQETVPALGHTVVTDAAVAATCTEAGKTAGSHCSVCGTVLTAQETVAALGHTVVTDAAVAATYTSTGLTEGSHCSVCGEVITAQEIVPVLTYDDTSYPTTSYPVNSSGTGVTEYPSNTESSGGDTNTGSSNDVSPTRPAEDTAAAEPSDTAAIPDDNASNPGSDLNTATPSDDSAQVDFGDVAADYWGAEAVRYVAEHNIFKGTSDTTFSPEIPMTRAMFITVLARLAGQDTEGGSTWYEKGLNWAVSANISDGTNLDGNITREQLATMLWRYAGEPTATQTQLDFQDADQVSSYALNAMLWANENHIINGVGGNSLNPTGQATRAEVAQMIFNYVTNLSK